MFEDEGSLRRRPRGFRRKQQLKAYAGGGGSAFYPTGSAVGYEISVPDLPGGGYISQPYGTYGDYSAPNGAGQSAFGTAADSWHYPSPEGLSQYSKITHTSLHEPQPPGSPGSGQHQHQQQQSQHPQQQNLDYGNYSFAPSPYSIDNGECPELMNEWYLFVFGLVARIGSNFTSNRCRMCLVDSFA